MSPSREYYLKNRTAILAAMKAAYAKDPAKYAARKRYTSAFNATATMVTAAKTRAKKSGVPFNITKDDVTIPAVCPVLGIPLFRRGGTGRGGPGNNSPTIDRVVNELGYTRGNIAVISHRANRIKQDATPQELEAVASWLRRMLKPLH